MKEEHGILSKKMFDLKFSSRSRSQRVVQDVFVPVDAFKQSCWANMPPELLRDVLMRIESSESDWPSRENVIACAGVCKSWREITKEIVKLPEVSGKLTFPISLKQPGPRESFVQCFINRNRSCDTYHLYLGANYASRGKFLLAARKCRNITSIDYIISLNADYISKGSNAIVGKLRANLLGSKFVVYDAQPPSSGPVVNKSRSARLASLKQVSPRVPSCNYHAAHISYDLHVMGARGPRRIQCVMDAIPVSSVEPGGSAPTPTEFYPSNSKSGLSLPFFRSKSTNTENFQSGPIPASTEGKLVLKNKSPRWHEQLQCWCLNFNGRVTLASVKNFQLVAASETGPENETVILQFGKVNHDVFTMDYRYPLSAFQAFAICLSSFDTRTACE